MSNTQSNEYENTTSTSASNFSGDFELHKAVFRNSIEKVEALLQKPQYKTAPYPHENIKNESGKNKTLDCEQTSFSLSSKETELLEEKLLINSKDHHGNTALHIAVLRGYDEVAELLINAGASMKIRNEDGQNAMQECIAISNRNLLRKMYAKMRQEIKLNLKSRAPQLIEQLESASDFYGEINQRFSSQVPFVSRFCPSDTFRIQKKGSEVRVDVSLVDFHRFSQKRGHISFVFKPEEDLEKPNKLYVIDYKNKTIRTLTKNSIVSEEEHDLEEEVEMSLQQELIHSTYDSDLVEFGPKKTQFGQDKFEVVENLNCQVYELKNFKFTVYKRTDHFTPELIELNKKQKHFSSKASSKTSSSSNMAKIKKIISLNIDEENSSILENEESENNSISEISNNLNEESKNLKAPCPSSSNISSDSYQECSCSGSCSGISCPGCRFCDESITCKLCNASNTSELFTEYESNDNLEFLGNHYRRSTANIDYVTGDQIGNDDDDLNQTSDSETDNKKFDRVERLEFPKYEPPNIEYEDYFSTTDEVNQNQKTLIRLGKDPKVTSTARQINASLQLTEEFPITIQHILPILEIIAPANQHAAKLRSFIKLKLPKDGFPIKMEIPLFRVLTANVTFQNFTLDPINSSVFNIPKSKPKDKKASLNKQSRSKKS